MNFFELGPFTGILEKNKQVVKLAKISLLIYQIFKLTVITKF